MTCAGLNLTQDFTFFRNLHKFHLFRVVQPNRPGMLQASHGGDSEVVIPFVSASERPTPVHAIFRTGTHSTIAKDSQQDTLLTADHLKLRPIEKFGQQATQSSPSKGLWFGFTVPS
jgi:hypothetical protein